MRHKLIGKSGLRVSRSLRTELPHDFLACGNFLARDSVRQILFSVEPTCRCLKVAAVATAEVRDRGDFWRRHRVSARGRDPRESEGTFHSLCPIRRSRMTPGYRCCRYRDSRVDFGTSIRR